MRFDETRTKTLGQIRKQRTVLLTLKVCPSSSDSGIVVDFTVLDIALGFFPSPFLALFGRQTLTV
jgi:hypothetical protein